MPDDPRPAPVEGLPTVVLEHARTGQPIVVDLRDYLAGRDGRYADWRLLGQGGFIDPPRLRSEGGPSDPEPPGTGEPDDPEADAPIDELPTDPPPADSPVQARRRRRKHRRSRP